jgi:hypothetical protein
VTRAGLRARRLVRRHDIDVVVTSGPPHSAHLAGLLATRGSRVPLVVDMRDPWAGLMVNDWGRSFFASHLNRVLIPFLEREVIQGAARVIANTGEFAETLAAAYPATEVSWLPNGIDAERLPAPEAELFEGLSLAYVGTVYAGRDLSPVLQALARFFARNPEARERGSRLRTAGHFEGRHGDRFRREVEALDLSALVEHAGVVPRGDALRLLARSHLSIVLAQNQALQIPAKLYESVGMHLPTLVIAEEESAAAREGKRIGALVRDPADVEGICALFEDLWSGRVAARVPPLRPIEYSHLAAEMGEILSLHLPAQLASTMLCAR